MIAYIFPGQGSQSKGMGESLFDQFKEYTAKADKILGYSIKDLCLNDSNNQINQTQYSQPAIYVVNALHYLKRISETAEQPEFVAGHSLGEYNALLAAEAFDFETGLKLVKKRGEIMAKAKNGGMAAIIGLQESEIKTVLNNGYLFNIDIVNYNAPGQIVISGEKKDIEAAEEHFENYGNGQYIQLNVSGAFHSRFMNNSYLEFSEFINKFNFSELKCQVISNLQAKPYGSEIGNMLAQQINHPVKWSESMEYILNTGEVELIEIGHSKTLTNLLRKIKSARKEQLEKV